MSSCAGNVSIEQQFEDRGKYSHSDSSVVARAREDARVGRMPRYSVDDAGRVGFELCDWGTCLSSPDVHVRICKDLNISSFLDTPKTWRTHPRCLI